LAQNIREAKIACFLAFEGEAVSVAKINVNGNGADRRIFFIAKIMLFIYKKS
jgi:hypothetical protein